MLRTWESFTFTMPACMLYFAHAFNRTPTYYWLEILQCFLGVSDSGQMPNAKFDCCVWKVNYCRGLPPISVFFVFSYSTFSIIKLILC